MSRKPSETEVGELIQALGLLIRRVRAAAGVSNELSLSESAVLGRLDKIGPASIADLARAEGVKPQSMGATVTALEQRGLVQRNPHPTDRRQMKIELTAKGLALRNDARTAKRTWLAQAVAELDTQEQRTLFAAGYIIKRLAEGA